MSTVGLFFAPQPSGRKVRNDMSKKRFTEKEIETLSKNPNVAFVSEKYIFYRAEFKEECIANVNNRTKTLRMTFIDAGFDIDMIGWDRIREAYKNWRFAYSKGKVLQTKHSDSGRKHGSRELSHEEIIARKDREIRRLKEENEFLRQLGWLERRYQPKKSPSSRNSNS